MTLRHRLEHAAVRGAIGALSLSSDGFRSKLARSVARLYFRLGKRRRAIAIDNLRQAFPALEPPQAVAVARRCAENFGAVFFDFLNAARLSREARGGRRDRGRITTWGARQGKGVLLSARFGAGKSARSRRAARRADHIVVRPLDNPLLDTDLSRVQEVRKPRDRQNAARRSSAGALRRTVAS